MMKLPAKVIEQLEFYCDLYNRPNFIENDPISIPHQYQQKQDIEITAFITAVLAWGQRKTIINKCVELFGLMDNAPYDFIIHHNDKDLKSLADFKHRTFNYTDLLYFIAFLKSHYEKYDSLEYAFLSENGDTKEGLISFRNLFFSLPDFPERTKKHIASPERNSTCKRLNMFLRWMVRKDNKGVDFGIWENISPSNLYCPFDVHVERNARKLNLIERKQRDWKAVEELTNNLRQIDAEDPIRFDFALFGMGVNSDI